MKARTKVAGAGAAAMALGTPMLATAPEVGAVLVGAGTAVTGSVTWWSMRGRQGTARQIARHDRRSRRNSGTASRWDILRSSSSWAMTRRAGIIRPSLAAAGPLNRWVAPVTSYATLLCHCGWQPVWVSRQDSTISLGAPGTGKTAALAGQVLDAPGGVVVASTAADLYELTAPVRAQVGPVAVFNPGNLGGLASSLLWSPLSGCEDPATADRRASDLMGPIDPDSEGGRWAAKGRRLLAALLHAAALGGYRVQDVQRWLGEPEQALPVIAEALRHSPAATAMAQAIRQVLGLNPKTRDGITEAAATAVAWTTLPAAAAAADQGSTWTIDDLLDRRGALYLICDENGTLGPLVSALVGEVVHQARQIAAAQDGGRLDPGLTLVLDEMALTCALPVDKWMAELRKRTIAIHGAAQAFAQLRQRWGADAASVILTCAQAVLLYGGCKDPSDLDLFARLTGEREEVAESRDPDGRVSTSTRRVPVVAAAQLAQLPDFTALLIRRGMPPALVRTGKAWKRRDVRQAAKQARKAPKPIPVSAPPQTTEPASEPVNA